MRIEDVTAIPKRNSKLYLNSTKCTRFYFEQEHEGISQFIQSYPIGTDFTFQCVDTAAGVNKKELITLKELHTYVCNSNEQMQDAEFLCNTVITDVPTHNGWSYVSCGSCSRKLEKYGATLRCNRCISSNVTGVTRYRVELNVHDDADTATFVVFDAPMTTLISKPASSLALECGEDLFSNKLPSSLTGFIGKRFCFSVKVTSFNFTPKHKTFTVSTITPLETSDENPQDSGNNIIPNTHSLHLRRGPQMQATKGKA